MTICRSEGCTTERAHFVGDDCTASGSTWRAPDGRPHGLIEWQRANGRTGESKQPPRRPRPCAYAGCGGSISAFARPNKKFCSSLCAASKCRSRGPRTQRALVVTQCGRADCGRVFSHYASQRRRFCSTTCTGLALSAERRERAGALGHAYVRGVLRDGQP